MSEQDKRYTLMLLRSDGGPHRQVSFSVRAMRRLLFLLGPLGCALVLAALTAIALYLVNLHSINDYDRLARRNHELEKQLDFFTRRVQSLNDKLTGLKESNARIKVLANLAIAPERLETTAMGGPDPALTALSMGSLDEARQESLRSLHQDLQRLELEISRQENELGCLGDHLQEKQSLLNFTPSIWPVRGWISSRFGYRTSPFTRRRELHKGVDIVNRAGTPVVATADGRVVFTGYNGGYGKLVTIDHGLGKLTKYGHLSRILVENGAQVVRGQKIALLGNTGRSTGPHLHYEVVVDGSSVNPADFLLD